MILHILIIQHMLSFNAFVESERFFTFVDENILGGDLIILSHFFEKFRFQIKIFKENT